MPTPENKVKAKVKALLKEFSCYQFWPVQTGYGAATLDCIGCHKGRYFSIETKAPGKKLTPRQVLTIEEMRAAGGVIFVIGEYMYAADFESKTNIRYSGMDELHAWLLLEQ